MNICNCGDFVKITLNDFDGLPRRIIIGLVLEEYENQTFIIIKLLLISAEVQEIWATHADQIEIIREYL